jgi:hypothetical protein
MWSNSLLSAPLMTAGAQDTKFIGHESTLWIFGNMHISERNFKCLAAWQGEKKTIT